MILKNVSAKYAYLLHRYNTFVPLHSPSQMCSTSHENVRIMSYASNTMKEHETKETAEENEENLPVEETRL